MESKMSKTIIQSLNFHLQAGVFLLVVDLTGFISKLSLMVDLVGHRWSCFHLKHLEKLTV
jgi:hypothetical protein